MMAQDSEHAAELALALVAAEEAAAMIVRREGAGAVQEKGRADLVTETDQTAERAILRRIRARFPEDGIVAEETPGPRIDTGRRWIVDPIDGTTNFVHRHPFVCVSIAFADERGPAAGVIRAPLLGETFYATRGGGAFLNGAPIRVSGVRDASGALFATGFPFRAGKGDPHAYLRLVVEVLGASHGIRRAGSAALDLAYVAAGRLDGYFELGIRPWDIAAGILLVEEAGGRVSGWRGDTVPPLESGRVLATNGAIHPWLEAIVARHAAAI